MPFRCVRPTGDMLLLGLILAGAESEARTGQAAAAARVAVSGMPKKVSPRRIRQTPEYSHPDW